MSASFPVIAYSALEACNAVTLDAVAATAERAGLPPGARVLDIGCGNGAVAERLAAMGFMVTAVELDSRMADLARRRLDLSPVRLIQGRSAEVLASEGPFDLIVALGSTDPAGGGLREPAAVLAALADHLTPGGGLLWGDLFWIGEPPGPLRQLTEVTNTYTSHQGWQDAARTAGLVVRSAEASDAATWDDYTTRMDAAARTWLAANADAPDAERVRADADRVKMIFDFGLPFIGFGLYLFGKPD